MPLKDVCIGDLVILVSKNNFEYAHYNVPVIITDFGCMHESYWVGYLFNNDIYYAKIYPNSVIKTLAKMQNAV